LDKISKKVHTAIIGKARSPHDPQIFHKISLMAFFAWIGLGADGLSSSCYGPEEAFKVLGAHAVLGVFVALLTVATIVIISTSYNQIVELFPTGGGGYVVASKLLSPNLGMVSGCALLVDYVLTIALSVSSGIDAIFSFLPVGWLPYKMPAAVAGVVILTVMNLRGVKESVVPLVPIFLIFIGTHVFAFIYTLAVHAMDFPGVMAATASDFQGVQSKIGLLGVLLLIMRAYSMGAGTFTGIEAVSNGLPILRDPKVRTAKRTMRYMATSLAVMVLGLMLGYLLFRVVPEHGKTLNAVLFQNMVQGWPAGAGQIFLLVTLISEATLLFVAAQTGFLDGPRVLANMALDRWFPTKFAMLSNRLVTQNGILLMGLAALVTVALSHGSVGFLVVLYSINVFITFSLSQMGMVRHWWSNRLSHQPWLRGILINGTGLVLCLFILGMVVVLKFFEGGWITILVTGTLIAGVTIVKRHYLKAARMLHRLNALVAVAATGSSSFTIEGQSGRPMDEPFDPRAKTAVLLVNGYNGLGLHTLFSVFQLFEGIFKNFVFVQVGLVDAGNFKGVEEVDRLKHWVAGEVDRYVEFMRRHGYYAEGVSAVGNDVIHEVMLQVPDIVEKYPNAVFFGGQIVFPEETFLTRRLHNYITFALQRRFYHLGTPFVLVPVKV
jgi:amino acid transporter